MVRMRCEDRRQAQNPDCGSGQTHASSVSATLQRMRCQTATAFDGITGSFDGITG
jgi:hypothetical protein